MEIIIIITNDWFLFKTFTILTGLLKHTLPHQLCKDQLKPENIHQIIKSINTIIPCVNKNANSSPDLVVFAPQIIIQFIKDPSPSSVWDWITSG